MLKAMDCMPLASLGTVKVVRKCVISGVKFTSPMQFQCM